MKVIGVMAVCKFPMWEQAVLAMLTICDEMYFRWDGKSGDPEIPNKLEEICGEKFKRCMIVDYWSVPQWRQDMLTLVSESAVDGDIILCPDEDEIFDDGLEHEIMEFIASDKQGMMFEYAPLVSDDGRVVKDGKPYPMAPHMKAFKWKQGLSYFPYHGNAVLTQYRDEECQWKAKTKIKHYCCYTKAMEAKKKFRDGNKAVKAVTLIGFGPSAKRSMEIQGEIWSLNNCYEALQPEAMKVCTRIFEMHQRNKRDKIKASDGQLHLNKLSECGERGARVIMLEQHADIKGSEAYPLLDVIKKAGVDWFAGTAPYMLAMAIAEGYNKIRIFGFDQLDWEHTNQRECFAGWCMYAIGRGIELSGCLTWLERYTKRYGYEYGPEWDDYQQELLWQGHPVDIRYKIESRIVEGKLFDGKR
jgi:hypothetical protein